MAATIPKTFNDIGKAQSETPDEDHVQPNPSNSHWASAERYGPPLPIMSHTEKQIPAVPVGSADLNQGPTASPRGRGDMIQVLLPNMARTATHKPRTNKDKVTELHLATYNVRTLSDECHLVSLENEIEKIKWDIIGISEMRRPGENVLNLLVNT